MALIVAFAYHRATCTNSAALHVPAQITAEYVWLVGYEVAPSSLRLLGTSGTVWRSLKS